MSSIILGEMWEKEKKNEYILYNITVWPILTQEREVNAVSQEIQGWPGATLARPIASNPDIVQLRAEVKWLAL